MKCWYKQRDIEAKKCGAAMTFLGGTSNMQVMVDPNSNVKDQFSVRCTTIEDVVDPMTFLSEYFTNASYFHPLALSLKDSLRDTRKTIKDKRVFYYESALLASAQSLLRTRKSKQPTLKLRTASAHTLQ